MDEVTVGCGVTYGREDEETGDSRREINKQAHGHIEIGHYF